MSTSQNESSETPSSVLRELLDELVIHFGVDARVELEEADGVLIARVEGEGADSFVGPGGQTIDAIQHLARRIVFGGARSPTRVVVDAGGYRERRAVALKREADSAAEEVVRSGDPVRLSPATASERRLVHEYLRERGEVRTESEGEEPQRRLVVRPLD